jgi:peptidoglycan/LPS O-acetylase OafA/YrhL
VSVHHPEGYRSDIDGLRAVAVLAVVIFHAWPKFLSGGFVGVDVFFVISGYLISGIIFRGIESGTFTFADFYKKRVKRIFPALTFIFFVFLSLGWFLLGPKDFSFLGKHIAAGAGFISNFILFKEVGYVAFVVIGN